LGTGRRPPSLTAQSRHRRDPPAVEPRRCRIPTFVKLQNSILKHRARILAAIEHKLSNARTEAYNRLV